MFSLRRGKNIRGDRDGIPQYVYSNKAKNDMTVQEWIKVRFKKAYAGFDVDVLDGDMKLGTLRDTYDEEDED